MGREVRKVPASWKHPKNAHGNYTPLLEGPFSKTLEKWKIGKIKWAEKLREDIKGNWIPINEKLKSETYESWAGEEPNPEDFMPEWPAELCTHYLLYETCTEGTPISPVMTSPEELAQWLVDNEASAFADMTATYEQWLAVCKGSWAPSAVLMNGEIKPGVTLGSLPAEKIV
jgi:hypothetical protein